eukprot:CAMPEP_0185310884 /NCGR_PEP_ID=MMETSP1363-20130426/25643_1 /TAXON_ID=38817 /ORGANISM="Gephyrocapsa oceanica, Strain RCC1303" /LENGTH=190 /DNA_ID=CAMNT_0027908475 /DNA_START=1 /DNA_END=573 /DNA_ORIENTATION=+
MLAATRPSPPGSPPSPGTSAIFNFYSDASNVYSDASSGAGVHDTRPDAPSIGLRSGSVLATPQQHQQPIHMPLTSREEDGGSFHFHSGLGLRGGKSIGRRSRTEAVNRLVLISVLTAGSAISLVALGCILAHRYPRASGGEAKMLRGESLTDEGLDDQARTLLSATTPTARPRRPPSRDMLPQLSPARST